MRALKRPLNDRQLEIAGCIILPILTLMFIASTTWVMNTAAAHDHASFISTAARASLIQQHK